MAATAHTIVDTIDHVTLERLAEAGAVRGANIVGQSGGWGVVIQYGKTERALAAERMKNAHEAAAYKGWLTQQVQEAIDDPRPSVPHSEVATEWARERAALLSEAPSFP
jgi:hypothetical protein